MGCTTQYPIKHAKNAGAVLSPLPSTDTVAASEVNTGTARGLVTYTEMTRRLRKMTKEQLRQYRSIKIEASQIERRLKEMESRTDDVGVTKALQDLYREKLATLVEGQLRIEKAIEGLNPTERELMRLRYIDGVDWTEVAETIHYEWAQTHRVHARALAKIKNL